MCLNKSVSRLGQLAMVLAVAATSAAQQPAAPHAVGELFASDASVRGSMVMTAGGTKVLSGSQVAAGTSAAVLRLSRGGEVRICPGTSVAVSQGAQGAPILFGINTGAMELQYKLESVSDALVTPDFRIQLIGPGTFHLAVGAEKNGDTCVKSLSGQNASIIVNEMMGEGTYQVAPGWSVVFKAGQTKNVFSSDAPCGCPAAAQEAVQLAKNVPVKEVPKETATAEPEVVEMEAPLVFHGKATNLELAQDMRVMATLRTRPLKVSKALVPSAAPKEEKKGFFGKIGAFFSKMFGR